MPVAEWPEMDRSAWAAAVQKGDLLDGQGPAAHWRPKTQRTVVAAYGRYLTFLDRNGWLDRDAGPEERLTPDRLRAYLAELADTVASVTMWGRITNLSEALRVMVPGTKYRHLNNARRRLKARALPSRNKRERIVPARDLVELGISLMGRVEKEKNTFAGSKRRHASVYRDGLMILMLISRPLRRDNFAALRLGTEFVKRDDRYFLAIPDTETKNHRPYERSLDPALTPLIDRYIQHYRPILLASVETDRFWISSISLPMSGGAVCHRLREVTNRAFGRPISPHFFRDIAMTTLGAENPELVWLGMSLLHHSDPRIAEKHYNQALESNAVRQYQSFMTKSRRKMTMQRAQGTKHRKKNGRTD